MTVSEIVMERSDGSILRGEIGLRTYGGSSRIERILIDGKDYLLKMPDIPKNEGYTDTSPSSEYLGCQILKSMGFAVQETELVLFEDWYWDDERNFCRRKTAGCLCKDMGKVIELDRVLRNRLDIRKVRYPGFDYLDDYVRVLNFYECDITNEEFRKFYYRLFTADALIGNTSRHNGNIGLLLDENYNASLSPVYDCGASFFPYQNDEWYEERNRDSELLYSTVSSIRSAVCEEGKKKMNYIDAFSSQSEVTAVLKDMVKKTDLNVIQNIIETTPFISMAKKEFCQNMVNMIYDRILLPAVQRGNI